MAVRIIVKGILPAEVEHIVDCYTCKTKFSFMVGDAKLISDQRDGDYYRIDCPICGNLVTKSKGIL